MPRGSASICARTQASCTRCSRCCRPAGPAVFTSSSTRATPRTSQRPPTWSRARSRPCRSRRWAPMSSRASRRACCASFRCPRRVSSRSLTGCSPAATSLCRSMSRPRRRSATSRSRRRRSRARSASGSGRRTWCGSAKGPPRPESESDFKRGICGYHAQFPRMMGASSMQKNRTAPAASPRALGRSLSRFSACLLAAWSIAWADEPRSAAPAGAAAAAHADPWWKHAVIYEIYPRSFQDSNGDGIGDLNGIAQRLDYLEALGVDAIWIAPMYPSPQVDFGYDISDYQNVDPQYGTLADFDRLLKQARAHHIRVLLDMVLNHTSDRHPWFVEAASSRTASRHDFYVWDDGKRGAGAKPLPPNNWVSLFGGSAWQYVPAVDQFYYHKFYRQQPDLNWRNPKVEQAMFGAMRFWLDRGVTGFRLDAITTLFEDPQLRDAPALGGTNAQGDPNLKNTYTDNLPQVHDVIRRMRAMIDSYSGGRLLVGTTYVPT